MHTKAPSTLKTWSLAAAIAVMSLVSFGCAISDYQGWLGHQTESEAKLWGSQIAILTQPDPTGDSGTYEYTVKYDWRNQTTNPTSGTFPLINIFSYRNPVFAAFSRDGCVDRDGDELQQRPGTIFGQGGCNNPVPVGKFRPKWEFEDRLPGCQFFANFRKEYDSPPKNPPAAALCLTAPSEEVDKDLDLQGSAQSQQGFSSLDQMFAAIWSGATGNRFTLEIQSVTLNGNTITLVNPAQLSIQANGVRPLSMAVDLNSAGAQELIRALLTTQDRAATTIQVEFVGGMRISQPAIFSIAFNHDELAKLLH
jgi:hypothetical protein